MKEFLLLDDEQTTSFTGVQEIPYQRHISVEFKQRGGSMSSGFGQKVVVDRERKRNLP